MVLGAPPAKLAQVFVPEAGDERCTCSIGISEVESGDQNIDAALRRADAALYDAKRSGRDRWKSYTPESVIVVANA